MDSSVIKHWTKSVCLLHLCLGAGRVEWAGWGEEGVGIDEPEKGRETLKVEEANVCVCVCACV